ncbi:MAG TPA: choice-of-anchor Q domain-containing protein [Thermoanaerobaculia bacterium]|nr:choice-of-anchor Q domain-containing protein [Thermoanaerobaculia bacterium]
MKHFSRNGLLALALMALAVAPAAAGVYIPTKTADTRDGACTETDCSLREAVIAANATAEPDVILLHSGVYVLGLAGAGEDAAATGDLDIADDLTLLGDGVGTTTVEGAGIDRVFHILAGASVEIRDVTVAFGAAGAGQDGGGILNAGTLTLVRTVIAANQAAGGAGGGLRNQGDSAVLTVRQSLLEGNEAAQGGGIAAQGTMTLANVTITNNTASGSGGGIYSYAGLDATINNATIVLNTATTQSGGGVFAESGAFTTVDYPLFTNSIIAANVAPANRDCSGAATSGGYNVLGVNGDCIDFQAVKGDKVGTSAAPLDARLSPLADNGGPLPTFALLANSPAVNAGNPAAPGSGGGACEATDQRGQARTDRCDIGAFERASAGCVSGTNTLCLNNDRFRVTATFTPPQGAGGTARAVEFTSDSGYLTFFDPNNVEVTVKVLNGCGLNNRYWVFLAGMTNVEVTVTVTDTLTGAVKTYANPQGRLFRTVADTAAFPCS